jgi:hypothetical protein
LSHEYQIDPILARVLAYWTDKRHGRTMPRRRDIDPIDLRELLPHIQLIDVVNSGARARYRYRLVGTSLVTAFGKEYTGKYLDELFTGERLRMAETVFGKVREERQPVFLRNRYSTTKDVEMVANRLYLPLSEDDRDVNVIMGTLTFEYGRGAAPGMLGAAALAPTIEVVGLELQS